MASNPAQGETSLSYSGTLSQVTVNAEVQNGEIIVTWDTTDPGGVHLCILSVQNPDGSWSNLDSGASGTYNYVNGILGHLYAFRVSATDAVGNPANAEVEVGLPRVKVLLSRRQADGDVS